jgi:hypothetical protein
MILAEDFWLRGKAAQSSLMQLWAYNTAFAGTATIQAWKMGLSAPTGFWQAMGRVGASNAPGADVVPLPKPEGEEARGEEDSPGNAARGRRSRQATDAGCSRQRQRKGPCSGWSRCPRRNPRFLGPSPHLLDAPRGGKADDLTVLKGVGAKLANALNEFGIYHFDQLATLDDEGIDWLNEQQAGFKMICARYDVVEQARARLA